MGFGGTIALVFAFVILGYLIARSGVTREGTGEALGDFVITVAIPVLLFRTLAEAHFGGTEPLRLWTAYFGAIAVTWAVGTMVLRKGFGRDARAGMVAGLAASFSNLVLLGIPLIQAVFGPEGFAVLSLLLAVHLPVMMTASVVLHEVAERRDGVIDAGIDARSVAVRLLRNLMRNPILIGIALGLLARLLPVAPPVLFEEIVDRLADLAGTLALVSLGMSLHRFGIASNATQGASIAAVKMLVMPTVAMVLCLALALPPLVAAVVLVCAASPTGVNPYLIANKLGVGEAVASNTMVMATAVSPVLLLFWLWVARTLF